MRPRKPRSRIFAAAILFAACLDVVAQGSLTPPGPPAPTMKTLGQVEPRFPISVIPTNLTVAGSYYLTTNLAGSAGASGISVSVSDVTLDLAGFALSGSGSGQNGVHVAGSVTNLFVANGVIRGWGGTGVNAGSAFNSRFENLRLSHLGGSGIILGPGSVIANSSARSCSGVGFYSAGVGTLFNNCIAQTNGMDGFFAGAQSTLMSCSSGYNAGNGIFGGESVRVQDCSALNNGANGVVVGGASTVQNCTIGNNQLHGLILSSARARVIDCTIAGNTRNGIESPFSGGHVVKGSTVQNNLNHGIHIPSCCSLITDNSAIENQFDGIYAGDSSQVTGNLASYNGRGTNGAGIRLASGGNRVENNSVAFNTAGVASTAGNNLIIRNTAQFNVTNFHIVGNQQVGPVISTTGTITNANPWANFAQ